MNNRKKQKVYKGSTMLIVLVAISFVALIGTVVMFTAYTNLALKRLNVKNKQSFYTAESVVDELYTGVGMKAMDNMSEAYVHVLGNKEVQVVTGGIVTTQPGTDIELNKKMRQKYIQFIMEEMGGKDANTQAYLFDATIMNSSSSVVYDYSDAANINNVGSQVCDNFKEALNEMIKNDANAQVNSVSKVEVYFTEATATSPMDYRIVVRDANVYYHESTNENYFSEVTVDFVIEYPTVEVTFDSERTNSLDVFKDYVFIGSQGVTFSGLNSATVSSGIFAGSTNAVGSGGLKFVNSNISLNGSTYVSTGDITVHNGKVNNVVKTSNVNFNNSKIWGQNLLVTSDNTKRIDSNSTLKIDGSSSIHLTDDLQINASYSQVNIGGNFWGYGMGENGINGINGHVNDSSIIVNGKGTSLTLDSSLQNLLVAGRAYIYYNGNKLSPTAESVALKGNQRYYLMPNFCMEAKYTMSGVTYDTAAATDMEVEQPMNTSIYESLSYYVNDTKLNSFFAVSLLASDNAATPQDDRFTQQTAGVYAYAYMNFKNNEARNDYLACLIKGEAYTVDYFASKGITLTAAQLDSYREMVAYTKTFLDTLQASSIINVSNGCNLYTTGLLLNYNASTANGISNGASIGGNNTVNPLNAQKYSFDLDCKYKILSHILLSYPEITDVNDVTFKLEGNNPDVYKISTYQRMENGNLVTYTIPTTSWDNTVFDNLIAKNALYESPYDGGLVGNEFVYAGTENITVPESATYGAVVTTGNVTVSNSFKGIIIADGVIYVNENAAGNAKVYSTDVGEGYIDLVQYLTSCRDGVLIDYIIPLQGDYSFGEADDQLGEVKYVDLVTYTNWRKTVGE